MSNLGAYFWALMIGLIVMIILTKFVWVVFLIGGIALVYFLYQKYGTSEKREYEKMKRENNKKRRIQEENNNYIQKMQQEKEKEEKYKREIDLKAEFELYKEKKAVFFNKNNIEDKPFFFWERNGNIEKIYVWKKNNKVYLCNGTDNYDNFKFNIDSTNNEYLFNKVGVAETTEEDMAIIDNSHIIKDTYHYCDSTINNLGMVLFGIPSDTVLKTKTLKENVVDVTIKVKTITSNMNWTMTISSEMLITLAEILPNVKVERNNKDEQNNYYVR